MARQAPSGNNSGSYLFTQHTTTHGRYWNQGGYELFEEKGKKRRRAVDSNTIQTANHIPRHMYIHVQVKEKESANADPMTSTKVIRHADRPWRMLSGDSAK